MQKIAADYPEASVAVSRLSVIKCLVAPLRNQEFELIKEYRTFFSRQDPNIVELVPEIIEKALWIRARHNIRTPDAIQAACALELPQHIFFTGDRAFQKISGLNI